MKAKKIFYYLLYAIALTFALFPIYWMALTSLLPKELIMAYPPPFIPSKISLDNWNFAVSEVSKPLLDSLIIAGSTTLVATILGVFSGYSFARFKVGGNNLLFWILSIKFLPGVAVIVPYYVIMGELGLLDTYPAIILPHLTIGLPFSVWMINGFVQELPKDLEDAAQVDGCGIISMLRHIVLPLIMPGIVVTALFVFIWSWTEFMFALVLSKSDVMPITVRIAGMREAQGVDWGAISASATIATAPILLIAITFQRYLTRVLTYGAIRG